MFLIRFTGVYKLFWALGQQGPRGRECKASRVARAKMPKTRRTTAWASGSPGLCHRVCSAGALLVSTQAQTRPEIYDRKTRGRLRRLDRGPARTGSSAKRIASAPRGVTVAACRPKTTVRRPGSVAQLREAVPHLEAGRAEVACVDSNVNMREDHKVPIPYVPP